VSGVRSWVRNADDSGFGLTNLPLGVFSTESSGDTRIGVRIGDSILDLWACAEAGLLDALNAEAADACTTGKLNALMRLGRRAGTEVRSAARGILDANAPPPIRERAARCVLPAADATLHVPARIGDYTDFYASIEHATNVGGMFRPDNPLLPNYKWIPIGYHGRASSIVVSGTAVKRPLGQTKPVDAEAPRFGPSRALDYEVEVGFYVGGGNRLGEPVHVDAAEQLIFGFSLVNDWSARDVQSWEYQPLGPFLAKNFATTVSPWVVLSDALEPFRVPARERDAGDPEPLPYLRSEGNQQRGAVTMRVEAWLSSAAMRHDGREPIQLSSGRFERMYWTPAQMVAHHASNGCNLLAGDLLASGTVSGATREERGCLLEITRRGADPVALPTGETRGFLEDGDEVILRGWCERAGVAALSLGECRGIVVEPEEISAVL
jgi:fumarylacetoacetase